MARQVTLGAGSAAPNTSGEASSLESVSRGVCAGAAVRREQARDRETVFVICVSSRISWNCEIGDDSRSDFRLGSLRCPRPGGGGCDSEATGSAYQREPNSPDKSPT